MSNFTFGRGVLNPHFSALRRNDIVHTNLVLGKEIEGSKSRSESNSCMILWKGISGICYRAKASKFGDREFPSKRKTGAQRRLQKPLGKRLIHIACQFLAIFR